jgi:hypothetical protein
MGRSEFLSFLVLLGEVYGWKKDDLPWRGGAV